MNELPMVIFTTFAQGSIGLFSVIAILLLFSKDTNRKPALHFGLIIALALLGLSGIGVLIEQRQPNQAVNTILGASHSNSLIAAMLTTALFGLLVMVYLGLATTKKLLKIQKLILSMALLTAVIALLNIADAYLLASVPTWASGWTVFQFLMSSVVIGIPATAMVLRRKSDVLGLFQKQSDKALATLAMMVLGTMVTALPLFLFWLGQLDLTVNLFQLNAYHMPLLTARISLLFFGLSCWVVSAMRGNTSHTGLTAFSVLMVLTSELCGRIFFFDLLAF